MFCYWLVKIENPDEDKIIYTTEDHAKSETVYVDGIAYRIIDKEKME